MIARTWNGIGPKEKADSYYNYLKQTGLNDYKNTKGNLGVKVLRRVEDQNTHFFLITFWDSYESIRQFAGSELDKARYYPEDKKHLLELPPFAHHYEILEDF